MDYEIGDLVNVRFTVSNKEMIGIIIDIDPNPEAKLKYYILVRGMDKLLWYMKEEIVGHVVQKPKI